VILVAVLAGDQAAGIGGRFLPNFQQDYKLLLCPLWLPLSSLQSVNSLSNNGKLLIKNRRLLEQFVMEVIKFSKCLEFHMLTPLSGWGGI
jgi:hypothetical protein